MFVCFLFILKRKYIPFHINVIFSKNVITTFYVKQSSFIYPFRKYWMSFLRCSLCMLITVSTYTILLCVVEFLRFLWYQNYISKITCKTTSSKLFRVIALEIWLKSRIFTFVRNWHKIFSKILNEHPGQKLITYCFLIKYLKLQQHWPEIRVASHTLLLQFQFFFLNLLLETLLKVFKRWFSDFAYDIRINSATSFVIWPISKC